MRTGLEEHQFHDSIDVPGATTFAFQDRYDNGSSSDPHREPRVIPWLAILAVGSCAIVAVSLFDRVAPPRKPPIVSKERLFEILSQRSTPWFQSLPNGRGFRLLRFDPVTEQMLLEEDLDGDGVNETVTRFD